MSKRKSKRDTAELSYAGKRRRLTRSPSLPQQTRVLDYLNAKEQTTQHPPESEQRHLLVESFDDQALKSTGIIALNECEVSSEVLPQQSDATADPPNRAEVSEQPLTCALSSPRKRKCQGSLRINEITETSFVQEEISANPMLQSVILNWYERFEGMEASLELIKQIKENAEIKGNGTGLEHEEKLKKEVAKDFEFIFMLTFQDLAKIFVNLENGENPLNTTPEEVFDLIEAILKCRLDPLSSGCSNQLWDLVYGSFKIRMNGFMQNYGFCCGHFYKSIPTMYCLCPDMCRIKPKDTFYVSGSGGQRLKLSTECYKDLKPNPYDFKKMKNNNEMEEERIKCNSCHREWHKYCALYVKEFESNDFLCPRCKKNLKIIDKSKFNERESWPKCELSEFIENKISEFFTINNVECGEVMIRVLSDSTSNYEMNEVTKLLEQIKENEGNYTYREKGIFAFQKCPDGNHVCFFGFYVQEYGKDAAEPNRDRVYISFLDSVSYFEPKDIRTRLYHEILCAYMEYVKRLDYKAVHLWISPPKDSMEYIFNNRPTSQKTPDFLKLKGWYQKMASLAREHGAILKSYTIEEYVKEFCDNPPDCVPYFKGDYWLSRLEKIEEVMNLIPSQLKSEY